MERGESEAVKSVCSQWRTIDGFFMVLLLGCWLLFKLSLLAKAGPGEQEINGD